MPSRGTDEYENSFPTVEKGGQGRFEMDGQPIESLSISLYPKGEVRRKTL